MSVAGSSQVQSFKGFQVLGLVWLEKHFGCLCRLRTKSIVRCSQQLAMASVTMPSFEYSCYFSVLAECDCSY